MKNKILQKEKIYYKCMQVKKKQGCKHINLELEFESRNYWDCWCNNCRSGIRVIKKPI